MNNFIITNFLIALGIICILYLIYHVKFIYSEWNRGQEIYKGKMYLWKASWYIDDENGNPVVVGNPDNGLKGGGK